jgi:hypothetical protein
VNDYLLHEMVRIRVDELRAEAAHARAGREARVSRGWRHLLDMLPGPRATRGEAGCFSRGTVEEACCA